MLNVVHYNQSFLYSSVVISFSFSLDTKWLCTQSTRDSVLEIVDTMSVCQKLGRDNQNGFIEKLLDNIWNFYSLTEVPIFFDVSIGLTLQLERIGNTFFL